MMLSSPNYGPFAPVVAASGTILAMGLALGLGWRGRTKWEPVEEDVSAGPQKVGGLIAAVAVSLIWVRLYDLRYETILTKIAIYSLLIAVASLIIYIMLQMLVYEIDRVPASAPPGAFQTERVKVIGGLWLRRDAKNKLGKRNGPNTVQELFEGAAFHKDDLWPRPAQGFSKVLFALGYIGLTVAGTVALGAASILVALRIKG